MKNIAIILILFSLAACKDNNIIPDETTPSEMLMRTWRVQATQINGQEDALTDYSNFRFTFNSDQTYSFFTSNERQGSWELLANATTLVLDPGTAQEEQVAVFELSETELLLEFTEESTKLGITRIRFELAP